MNVLSTIAFVPRLVYEYVVEYRTKVGQGYRVEFSDFFRSFFAWLWSVCFSAGSLADRRPWITFAATRFLGEILSRESRVFEYGTGGSTLYFAQRVGELVSVEHDASWLERTSYEMRRRHPKVRWQPHLAEAVRYESSQSLPDINPCAYASTDASFRGMSFKSYAGAIDRYPHNYFDVVLIDGRARPSCFRHALTKTKVGGYIVLDNAEREQYSYVEEAADRLGFEKTEFWGPGPYNRYFWRTIFLRKLPKSFGLGELDLTLERYVDIDGGIFVEAGANDGVRQSNTLYLELYRGWRGLLVEPVPDLAEQCRMYRSGAAVEQVALVSPEREGKTVIVRYAHLMSVVKGGMKSQAEEDSHIEAGMRVQKVPTYEVEVPTATLSTLLDKHGMQRVDLLSLDVEGYELNVLKGLDLTRHQPRFIVVEARYRTEVHEYLSPLYELLAELSHHDLLYRLKPRENQSPDAGSHAARSAR